MGPTHPLDEIADLLVGWERMSGHYLAGRGTLVSAAVTHLAERIDGRRCVIVELGSGPGVLLADLAIAIPTAELIGIEIDPVLRDLQRLGSTGVHGSDRVRIVDADMSDPGWIAALPPDGTVNAVVAVQVLHYFSRERMVELLGETRTLAPNGVFVHVDHVPPGRARTPTMSAPDATVDDPWAAWWAQARQCEALADAFTARDQWLDGRPVHSAEYHPDHESLRSLFEQAGLGSILPEQRVGDSQLTIAGCS